MEIKKTVKRIAAVGAGAAMLGATAMGALATVDLKDYPSMFVSEGSFNGYIVVGENAKPIDNLAATDIASSMKTAALETSGSVSVEGDAWEVGTSAKVLEMANNVGVGSAIEGETFSDINSFIGSDELEALQDGVWETNSDRYDFQQFLFFDNVDATSGIVKYAENDDDVTGDHLYFADAANIARYKMEFTSTAQSDVTDADGASDVDGQYLDDFENTKISMFGKDYSIVQARRPTTDPGSIKLTLMAGASTDTLLEGESKTYDAAGKKYDVALSYVDDTYAKFTVNGQATNKLRVGETFVLADGSEIGVSEVLYQSYAGGIHSTTFYIGAQKMELRDDDVIDSTTGDYTVKLGEEDIEGTEVIISGDDDDSTFSISTIEIDMTAESEYFVPAGKKLSETIKAAEDDALLMGGAFDVEYKGITTEETHELGLKTSSSRRYQLTLFDGDSNAVDIPVAYAEDFSADDGDDVAEAGESEGQLTLGQEAAGDKELVLDEDTVITKDDYFILTSGDSASGAAKSYLLQYKGSDDSAQDTPKIKFKNLGSGETLEYSQSAVLDESLAATIKLGGYSFEVFASEAADEDDFDIQVDLDGSGAVFADLDGAVNFVDSFGSEWEIVKTEGASAILADEIVITQSTPNTDDYDNQAPDDGVLDGVELTITGNSDSEVDAAIDGFDLVAPEGTSDVTYGYSSMGSFMTFDEPSSNPAEFTMSYPKAQRVPQVFVTSGAVTSGAAKSGKTVAVNVVDASRLDSEISDVKAQNLIVVGGPCVNSVAASLVGNPADCTEGFTPGKARVKLFEQANGNVAMLVAGYSGEDTRLAGKVVAQQAAKLLGSEVEIEGTSLKDVQVGAPSPAGTQ